MAMHHGGDAGWRSKVKPESPSLTILSGGPEFDSEKVKSRILRCFIGNKHLPHPSSLLHTLTLKPHLSLKRAGLTGYTNTRVNPRIRIIGDFHRLLYI